MRKINHKQMTYAGDGDITKPNPYLNAAIIEAVDNQIRDNTPPVAKETFERLQQAGYSAKEAKEKIAAILIADIYDVMTTQTPHNEVEYERKLRAIK